jgi:hypothetical protein
MWILSRVLFRGLPPRGWKSGSDLGGAELEEDEGEELEGAEKARQPRGKLKTGSLAGAPTRVRCANWS